GGGPQYHWRRRPQGPVPGRRPPDADRRRPPEELRAAQPGDEGPLGRPQRGRRFRRVPWARRDRLPGRGLRLPRGPRHLEGRLPREDARGPDGLRPRPGREELPDPRGPRPPPRPRLV